MFLFCMWANCQNLVPNYSFEDTVLCPNNSSQIDRAVGWSAYRISPDYYNPCDTNPLFGVPFNFYGGYQLAATGVCYAGFTSFFNTGVYREILGTQLLQPLTLGKKYFVSFKVSRGKGNNGAHNMASNKLGARFTMTPYDYFVNPIPIDNFAQVYTDSIITDTINWVNIAGCFVTDSAYQYVCFGNLFDDANTNFLDFTGGINPAGAYYYIDDVVVTEDTSLCPTSTSIYTIPNQAITVYPNPFLDAFFIDNPLNEVFELSLFDSIGNLIRQLKINKGKTMVDLIGYAEGFYWINLKTANKNLRQKIIKINN